jgi:hypothetical protein
MPSVITIERAPCFPMNSKISWAIPMSSRPPRLQMAQYRQQLSLLGRGSPHRRNVWIGGGAIILLGITIGDDAIVDAGSVATRNVPPGATVIGNPARVRA